MFGKIYNLMGRMMMVIVLITIMVVNNGFSQGPNTIIPELIQSCMADSVRVSVYPDVDSVEWFNGDTAQYTWVLDTGYYTVSGMKYGDLETDSFYVYILPANIIESDTSINCGDTIVLHGSDSSFDYTWSPGEIIEDSAIFYPRNTSSVYVIINESTEFFCEDSVLITVEQLIQVDTLIQSIIGCPDDSVAQAQIFPSGGFPPYSYEWPPEATALLEDPSYAYGLVNGDKTIKITDSIGCNIDHPFVIKAHRLPDLELFTTPEDEVYIQNPWVTFSYENPTYDSLLVDTFLVDNQWWDFGDSTEAANTYSPTYAYKNEGIKTVILTFKTKLVCFGTDTTEIDVLPVELVASAVITPNGDEKNEFFELFEENSSGGQEDPLYKRFFEDPIPEENEAIDLSKYYMSNELVIFNRWGEKVYEVDNYDNDWDGGGLKDGTYFYIIKCTGQYRTDVFKGSFMILGSGYSE